MEGRYKRGEWKLEREIVNVKKRECGKRHKDVAVVSLGKEDNGISEEHSSLVPFYLGHRANESQTLESTSHVKVYQGVVLGHVQIIVYEYPDWDTLNGDSPESQNRLQETDIIVIKFSVNNKADFLDIKNNVVPHLKQLFSHSVVPSIVVAIGTRGNDAPLCTCPMCTSDREISVTANEGLQLAKDIGATYLELSALNDFFVVKYFGGVLEYFIVRAMNQKSAVNGKKKKKKQIKPPQLLQPEKMPAMKDEPSRYAYDMQKLLISCQCMDVIFCTPELGMVTGGHRVVLCGTSPVFMLLFGGTSARDIYDSSTRRTTQALFSVHEESAVTANVSLVRIIVKDPDFLTCLSDILSFIYSGTTPWQQLKAHIKEKLKNAERIEHIYHLVQRVLRKPGKVRSDESFSQCEKPLQLVRSLGQFYNNPVLADVIFQVQGTEIPAHRAVLVARCEVMAAMFSGRYSEANHVLIPVHDISKDTFLAFLEYVYKDSFYPASILQAMSLLICSEMYQVPRLQSICEQYIIAQLQSMPSRELSSTSLDIICLLQQAKFYHSECLYTWLLYFIAAHYLIFSHKPEFQDLSAEEIEFVEKHRWPSNFYLKQLVEYQRYIHSPKQRCDIM
ncbi:rho-related BTB domain-containing protein 3 [Gastrophryne carolinensis]